jgi:hypothetical protein
MTLSARSRRKIFPKTISRIQLRNQKVEIEPSVQHTLEKLIKSNLLYFLLTSFDLLPEAWEPSSLPIVPQLDVSLLAVYPPEFIFLLIIAGVKPFQTTHFCYLSLDFPVS